MKHIVYNNLYDNADGRLTWKLKSWLKSQARAFVFNDSLQKQIYKSVFIFF